MEINANGLSDVAKGKRYPLPVLYRGDVFTCHDGQYLSVDISATT